MTGKAEEEYKLALGSMPNDATTHHYYGEFLGLTGRFAEAEQEMQTAFQLDPLSLIQQTDWAYIAIYERKYHLAVDRAQRVLRLEPQHAKAHWVLAMARLYRGDSEAVALADTPREAGLDEYHAMYRARDGHPEEALKLVRFAVDSDRYVSPFPLVALPTVSKRLGHSSVYVTATVYSHALSKDETAAAEVWDATVQSSIDAAQRSKIS
jgi:tetratricopeptide (TPR) repeat protein